MALTKELIQPVLDDLFAGMSLRKSLELRKINTHSFFDFIDSDPVLSQRYARAQFARSELFADEILDIADTEADPQKARNRIDARKWYASKMQPQKYGDKLDLNVNATVDIAAALAEGKQRAQLRGRSSEIITDAEIVETKQIETHSVTGSKPDSDSQPLENRDAPIFDPDGIFA